MAWLTLSNGMSVNLATVQAVLNHHDGSYTLLLPSAILGAIQISGPDAREYEIVAGTAGVDFTRKQPAERG